MMFKLPDRRHVIALVVIVLGMSLYVFWPKVGGTKGGPIPPAASAKPATAVLEVGVIVVSPNAVQGKVLGYGEVQPRYQLALKAEVSGRIIEVADSFESGRAVANNELLARIDPVDYQQAVAAAKTELAGAEQLMLEEERESRQAQTEWKQSGLKGEPDQLALRVPQLKTAQAELTQYQQQLLRAERDLNNSRIVTPFAAIVVSRDVGPGSYVQAGTQVGTLYSSDRAEITVPLAAEQWQVLPDELVGLAVELRELDSNIVWPARVERTQLHVATDTRQRSLVVVVDNPLQQAEPLFPGVFVEVTVDGKMFTNLWSVPETAITQTGELWYVDDTNLLQRYHPEVVFRWQSNAYVKPLADAKSARIVLRPLSSYLVGIKVTPLVSADS